MVGNSLRSYKLRQKLCELVFVADNSRGAEVIVGKTGSTEDQACPKSYPENRRLGLTAADFTAAKCCDCPEGAQPPVLSTHNQRIKKLSTVVCNVTTTIHFYLCVYTAVQALVVYLLLHPERLTADAALASAVASGSACGCNTSPLGSRESCRRSFHKSKSLRQHHWLSLSKPWVTV